VPSTPQIRLRQINDARPRADGQFVLYWMLAARRTRYNFGLQRAIEAARELGRPLVVLEALPCGCRWDCDRFHHFVLDGVAENARRLRESRATYYPYAERSRGDSRELVAALGEMACVVVTDDSTTHCVPDDLAAMARRLPVRAEAVDSNGLVPLEAGAKAFATAHSFRRFLQDELLEHLAATPAKNPLARLKLPNLHRLPPTIVRRWPPAGRDLLTRGNRTLNALPINHSVSPVAARGGATAARAALRRFLDEGLSRYADDRNQPEEDVTSGLSPYLHYGHISAHEVFAELMAQEGWSPDSLSSKRNGSRSGWWGVNPPAEAFLDQLVTWRELGHNMCWRRRDCSRYESLPEWARRTLGEHAADLRPYVYGIDELEQGRTHDALWNAAQMQLVREGRLHNYLRMLWGKKILEWSPTPEDALEAMIELNNKYALDGQDPNSYSGILWIFGRYDRPWGPERPIFGKVRYMSSENTARKVRVRDYIRRYAP
jgi:deoxyribodipyrimidine photo-lyase